MTHRRRMMMQQNQGFELVYSAASGKLPQDVGYTYNNSGTLALQDNSLVMTGTSSTRCRLDLLNATALNKSFEIEFTPVDGTTSIRLFNGVTKLNLFVTSTMASTIYGNYSVGVYNTWEQPYIKKYYKKGDTLRLKLVIDGEIAEAYYNDELIYNLSTPVATEYNVANFDVSVGSIKVHKIIYKEW